MIELLQSRQSHKKKSSRTDSKWQVGYVLNCACLGSLLFSLYFRCMIFKSFQTNKSQKTSSIIRRTTHKWQRTFFSITKQWQNCILPEHRQKVSHLRHRKDGKKYSISSLSFFKSKATCIVHVYICGGARVHETSGQVDGIPLQPPALNRWWCI